MSRRTEIVILLVVLGVAAWIRLWGMGWGLPYAYHPDEGSILFHALGFGTGDLNPHWFRWPSLLMYFMFGVYGVYYVIGRLAGTLGVPLDLVRAYLTDLSPFWLAGRLVSAAAGVATVWVTYLFGRRAFGRFVGLAAAAFLAVVFLHVRDSHYATPDVVTTFLASLSLLLALKACASGRVLDLALSGLLAGLAASAKYPGVLAGAGTAAAFVHLAVRRKIVGWALPAAAALCVIGFVAGTPFAVVSRSEFARDVLRQFTMVSQAGVAQEASSFWGGLREIFVRSLGRGVGYPLVVLAAVGAFLPALGRRWPVDRGERSRTREGPDGAVRGSAGGEPRVAGRTISVAYVAVVLAVMSLLTVKRSTYLTPALPAIAVLAAVGIEGLVGRVRAARPYRYGTVVALGVAVLAVVPSVRYDAVLGATDTRTRAKAWIEETIQPGSAIAVEDYGPVLNPTDDQLTAVLEQATTRVESWQGPKRRLNELTLEVGARRTPQFEVYGIGRGEDLFELPNPARRPEDLADRIADLGIRYVVLSSKAQPTRPMEGAESAPGVGPTPFQDWLSENATLAAAFVEERSMPVIDRGRGRSFHNPVIEVYEIRRGESGDSSGGSSASGAAGERP